jgi:hypothetical protein
MASSMIQSPMTSPTAAPGQTSIRTEHIYSAVVVQHGGSAAVSMYLNAKGQNIPVMGSLSGALPQSQQRYSDLTTNLVQSGQTGGTIGDALLYSFGLTIQQASFSQALGTPSLYGGTTQEFGEILAKLSFVITLVNREQIQGPVWAFPSTGGIVGSVAIANNTTTTGASGVVSVLSNGVPGIGRQLQEPLPLARVDTLQGILAAGNNDTLVFSQTGTTSAGQSTLIWCNAVSTVSADVIA